MTDPTALETVAKSRYVSLTTFRKSGDPVATAMWVAQDADGTLIISTHSDSGKVKRLKNDARVELRPSTATGAVKPDAVVVTGTAELIADLSQRAHFVDVLHRKYGFQQRFLAWVEARRGSRAVDRVILRITPQ
jgi:PPOX class probable F420-dependent enzyme